jgi:hypothetical protein
MEIPLFDLKQKGRSSNVTACRTINFFPHTLPGNEVVLYGTPGCEPLGYGVYGPSVRGAIFADGVLYYAQGSSFGKIVNDNFQVIGTTAVGTNRIQMEFNGFQILQLIDGLIWIYDISTGTLTQFVQSGFPLMGSLVYLNGYFIATELDGQRFFWSNLYNGAVWDALDFASAESTPDGLVGAVVVGSELKLMGETTIETWYNVGGSDVFAKQQGATTNKGVGSLYSAKVYQNGFVYVDYAGTVQAMASYTPQKISNDALDYELSKVPDLSICYGNTYEQEGKEFYCLTFNNQTWVFDGQLWHQRSSKDGAWLPFVIVQQGPNVYGGARDSGQMHRVAMDVNLDDGEPIKRSHVLPEIQGDMKRLRLSRLEMKMESGVGINLGQGQNPVVWLDWSDDGGHAWSNALQAGIGKIGQYLYRIYWQKLGSFRSRFFRISMSDPVKPVIIAAYGGQP